MGMDVYGREPKTETGKYFRANVWSWRPIHALIEIANLLNGERLVPDDVMLHMGFNDGAGLKTKQSCNALADAIERLLLHPSIIREHGMEVLGRDGERFISFPRDDSTLLCDKTGRLYSPEDMEAGEAKREDLRSAYQTSEEHVREFITFLRNCGGFEVC